jgi:hypothetical protein
MRRTALALAILASAGCSLEEIGLMQGTADSGGLDAGDEVTPPLDSGDEVGPNDAADDSSTDDAAGDVVLDTAGGDGAGDAGPIITVTGGSYTLDGDDAGVCSSNQGQGIGFTLVNQHGSSVDLIWVDPQCAEHLYATVASGNSVVQGTYINHVWRVRETLGQAFLAEFILTQNKTYTVTIH